MPPPEPAPDSDSGSPPTSSGRTSTPSRGGRPGADRDAYSSGLWKLAGIGMTMTSEVVGGALLGFGLDYLFKTGPVLLIVFTLLGVGVGMVGFLRSALGASGDAGRDARSLVAAGRAAPLPDDPEPADDEEDEEEDEEHEQGGHDRDDEDAGGSPRGRRA